MVINYDSPPVPDSAVDDEAAVATSAVETEVDTRRNEAAEKLAALLEARNYPGSEWSYFDSLGGVGQVPFGD